MMDVLNITTEQYQGNEPATRGSEWLIDGKKQNSQKYLTKWGIAETVIAYGEETLVAFEAKIKVANGTMRFNIYGYESPWLTCTFISEAGIAKEFFSEVHSPIVFDKDISKYLKNEAFNNKVGKMAVKKIGDILRFDKRYDR